MEELKDKQPEKINPIRHVAIIMDGNGRWAEKKGLSRAEGHKAGAEAVRRALNAAELHNIDYLTLYAFSTENWKRPKTETTGLMSLLKEFLELNYKQLMEKDVKLRVIGRIEDIPFITRQIVKKTIEATKNNKTRQLILALSYGSRAEIVDAVKKIAKDVKSKKLKPEKIDEAVFSSYLYAPDVPDPDLMIRTSGEYRISNFLLWQISYSELWITDTLWPDFNEEEFAKAIEDFKFRKRRFGGI